MSPSATSETTQKNTITNQMQKTERGIFVVCVSLAGRGEGDFVADGNKTNFKNIEPGRVYFTHVGVGHTVSGYND